jgi:hypothetical protein
MPDLKLAPAHCPRCLDSGTVWDFAHVLKIRCECQPTPTALELPKAA